MLSLVGRKFFELHADYLFHGRFVRVPGPRRFVLNLGAGFVPDVHRTGSFVGEQAILQPLEPPTTRGSARGLGAPSARCGLSSRPAEVDVAVPAGSSRQVSFLGARVDPKDFSNLRYPRLNTCPAIRRPSTLSNTSGATGSSTHYPMSARDYWPGPDRSPDPQKDAEPSPADHRILAAG